MEDTTKLKTDDFRRGRTFGIRTNTFLAIVIKRRHVKVWWVLPCSYGPVRCNYVADLVKMCYVLGPIDRYLLRAVEFKMEMAATHAGDE